MAETGRLALLDAATVEPRDLNGLFAVLKDEQRDRLILDARPPNRLEAGLCRWTKLMVCSSALLDLHLPPDFNFLVYSEDLRDFYYDFVVSDERPAATLCGAAGHRQSLES